MSEADIERRLPNSQIYSASHRQIEEFRRVSGLISDRIGPLRVDLATFRKSDAEVLGVRTSLPGVYKETVMLAADLYDILPQPIVRFLVQRWPFLDRFLSRSGRIEYRLERRGENPLHFIDNTAAVQAVDGMLNRLEPRFHTLAGL